MGLKTQIGGFSVQPLSVPHSVECYAFIISHKEVGKILFATDCSSFRYKIKDLHHIIIEANYSNDILIDNFCDGNDSKSLYSNHMELQDTIEALKVNYSPHLQNIVLCHLSNNNSNEQRFIEEVKKEICLDNVYIAKKDLTLQLSKEEF